MFWRVLTRHSDALPRGGGYPDEDYDDIGRDRRYDEDYGRRRDDGYDRINDQEDDYYRDHRPSAPSKTLPKLPSFRANRKLGTALSVSGISLTILGFALFFNKTLLRLGNLLLILGVPLTIGPSTTARYFLNPKKLRATGCLLGGILLVMVLGWPVMGITLEVFGLLNLFGNLFPVLMVMIRQVPFVGNLMKGGKKRYEKQERYDREEDQEHYY